MKTIIGMAAALALLAGAAFAADKPADAPVELWHKACAKEGDKASCAVQQFAIAEPGNIVVLRVQFALQGDGGQAGGGMTRLVVTAPLGVMLRAAVQMTIDGDKPITITIPFTRCTNQGCEAEAVLDKAARQNFERGKRLVVRYFLDDQKPLDVPIRLDGLAAALKTLS